MDSSDAPPTRESSTDSSSSSALSNIDVAAIALLDSSSDRGRGSASTPPTSLPDTASMESGGKKAGKQMGAEEETRGRRPRRVRSGVSTYNLKKLSDAQLPAGVVIGGDGSEMGRRDVSRLTGRTLVAGEEEAGKEKGLEQEEMEWESTAAAAGASTSAGKLQRRPSVKKKVKRVAGKVGSVLGKRSRDMMEAGKRRLGRKGRTASEPEEEEEDVEEEDLPRWKKELDTGTKGVLDELDLDAEPAMPPTPPAKKARQGKKALKEIAQPPAAPPPLGKAAAPSKRMKRWEKQGLYVGQDANAQSAGTKKLQKKHPSSSDSKNPTTDTQPAFKRTFMTLPMFAYLDKTRDFTIPFDVFAPSWKKGDEKPKDWHQVNRNRLVGEAKDLWEKSERLPASMCVCSAPSFAGELGCDEVCLNRVMQYECNDENCNLPATQCSNRAFTELATRTKKGGPYDVGVEVLKTPDRGFGVRSCRTWAPGQIIMEYTGEIVSEGECQRRMREEYKDKQCYYLMELERGLIIDGTKGSMARFINHSCEPNCEVRMVKVNGTPRMGVFAGERGIATGEELTYDYNFDNFGTMRQKCYCGAPNCRGYLSKRLNKEEQKRQVREENERKRKAAEEAQAHAVDEDRKKKAKTERGSNWRGWVAIDDPETRERLKQEKKEREEREKNSSRAQRIAARRGSLPAAERPVVKKSEPKRRKTTTALGKEVKHEVMEDADEATVAGALEQESVIQPTASTDRPSPSPSAVVDTIEPPTRPTSAHSTATITRKTEITITETATTSQDSVQRDYDVLGVNLDRVEAAQDEPPIKRSNSVKDAVKSVGQAVRNGLLMGAGGSGKGKVQAGGEKLKQSKLSFGKLG